MKILPLIAAILVSASACVNTSQKNRDIPVREHTVLAVLWQQHAAEYRALCHQAFNIARLRLQHLVKSSQTEKPLAIITDLDETILDNTPYSSELIDNNTNYRKETWNRWGRKEAALLVPGAEDFLKQAQQWGVEVFYVSNRGIEQSTETLNNLKKYGLPNTDEAHLFLKSDSSSKRSRRSAINKTHEVVMLLGDNLSDFDEVFENLTSANRNQKVHDMQTLFGEKFIVFPNPIYGDWETDGLYDGQFYDDEKKRQVRHDKLRR